MDIKAYEGQENFELIIQTDIDFDTYVPSAQEIEYIDPDGVSGVFTAIVVVGSETDGKIKHTFAAGEANDIPPKGVYMVRADLTINAKHAYTQPQPWFVGGF